jgi:hypothetical protein
VISFFGPGFGMTRGDVERWLAEKSQEGTKLQLNILWAASRTLLFVRPSGSHARLGTGKTSSANGASGRQDRHDREGGKGRNGRAAVQSSAHKSN